MRRARRFGLVLLAFAGWLRVSPGAEAQLSGPVAYFESVSSVTSAPASFYVSISFVDEGLPADKAGILKGDHIIGLDGLRVRNYAEYDFLRRFHDQRPSLTLTIARQGRITEITIPDPKPIRRGGFGTESSLPVFTTTLATRNIRPADVLSVPPPPITAARTNDLAQLLVEAFLGSEDDTMPMATSDSLMALNAFPARGQEAVARLMASNSDADRSWIIGLLKVYGCLLFERYDEAAQVIAAGKLLDRKPDPFLDNLLRFYQRLIEHRISAGSGIRLDDYGVDIPFFAMCFPYPVMPDSPTNAFSPDPALQDLLLKALSGPAVYRRFQERIEGAAFRYAQGTPDTAPAATDVERYIGQVKASVLDPDNHGGWPYRSYLTWKKDLSATMVKALHARLAERPEAFADIALCLVAPSAIAGDEASFRTACEMNLRCGPMQYAIARNIIRKLLLYGTPAIPPARCREIVGSLESAVRVPALYAYLNKVSPSFGRRYFLGRSFLIQEQHGVFGLSTYCFNSPFVVGKALERPVMWEQIAGTTDIDAREDDPEVIANALELLKIGLAFCPEPRLLDNLIKLCPRVGAGKTFDAIRYAVACHDVLCRETYQDFRVPDLYIRLFSDVETRSYGKITAVLEKMDPKDPALPQKIAALYAESGVPSICLLLSKKLKEAGNPDLATHYLRLAVDFWDAVAVSYGAPSAATWAGRDLASTPGFEDLFRRYAGKDGQARDRKADGAGPATDSGCVLEAIVESYLGDYDGVVRNLIRSGSPAIQKLDGPFLYRGETFASCHYLRLQFLTDLLKSNKLSESQIAQLKEARGLNFKALLEALGK